MTPLLLVEASVRCVALGAVIERSLDLTWRSEELRRTHRLPRLGRIAGGSDGASDSALIMNAISAAALCLACLAQKSGLSPARAEAGLKLISETFLIRHHHRCAGCFEGSPSFTFIGRLGVRSVPGGPKRNQIILAFLERRRGERFCAECISGTLFARKSVDNSLRQLEGLGARRRHGICSMCGRPRLVSGLDR